MPFDIMKDIAPATLIGWNYNVLVVIPSLPVTSVKELISYARAHPGELNFGSGGNATPAHIAGEFFKLLTATEMTHVPYRSLAAVIQDMLAGRVQLWFGNASDALPQIQVGNSQGLRNQNRRLHPTTRLPIGVKILASDLRDSVPAHGSSHSLHGTYLGPTRGLVGACPNERRSLVPPPGMASRLARFARRTGLRYFANLDPVGAIVGNPAERLNGIQTTTRKADTSYERPRPRRTLL